MYFTRSLLKTHCLFMPVNVVEPKKAGMKLSLAAQSKSETGAGAQGKTGKGAGAGEVEGAGEKSALESCELHGFQARGGTGEWAGI